jgi:hypothetical protein
VQTRGDTHQPSSETLQNLYEIGECAENLGEACEQVSATLPGAIPASLSAIAMVLQSMKDWMPHIFFFITWSGLDRTYRTLRTARALRGLRRRADRRTGRRDLT